MHIIASNSYLLTMNFAIVLSFLKIQVHLNILECRGKVHLFQ